MKENKEKEIKGKSGDDFPFELSEMGKRIDEAAEKVGGKSALKGLTGISLSHIYRVTSGQSDLPTQKLNAIANATGYNMQWLATGEGPKLKGELPTAISFKQVEDLDTSALLDACIMVREEEDEEDCRLSGRQLAKVLYLLYTYVTDNDARLSEELVHSVVKAELKSDKSYKEYEPRRKKYGETRHYKDDEI